ncbi:hypothetical protein IKQ21_09260 [bacterium]|nr:hypothetical protein [bacterium]
MRVSPIPVVKYSVNPVKTKCSGKNSAVSTPSFNGFWKVAGGAAGAILGMATVGVMGAPALLAAPFLYAGMKWGEDKDRENEQNNSNSGKNGSSV